MTPQHMPSARVTLETAPLRRLVAIICRKVIERRNVIPIISCISFAPCGDGVTLSATDLEIFASATLPGVSGALVEGFAINAYALRDMLAKVKATTITLEESDGRAVITNGASRFTLPAMDAAEMPTFYFDHAAAHSFTIDAPGFADDLARLAPFMSSDEKRRYLCGVGFTFAHGRMVMAATDAKAMSLIDRVQPCGSEAMGEFIVMARAVAAMREALKKQAGAVRVSRHRYGVCMEGGGLTISGRAINDVYPDMQRAAMLAMGEGVLIPLPMPEIEPHLIRKDVEKVERASVDGATWQRGKDAVLVTDAAAPDWCAVICLASEPVYSKGFAPQGDTFEYQDDEGNWHVLPLAVGPGGAIDLSKETVRALCEPVVKDSLTAAPVAPVADPVAPAAPSVAPIITHEEPAPMSEAFAALCSDAPAPAPASPAPVAPSDDVAALRATVEALLGRVTALEANQPVIVSSRAPREVRERMVRAYLRTRAEREQARRDYADIWQQQTALAVELEEERTERREMAAQMSSLARELLEAREALARSEAERLTFAHDTAALADELRGDLERAHEETGRAVDRADMHEAARVAADERAARMEARANALEAAQAAFATRPAAPLPVVDLPRPSAIVLPLRASSRREVA